VSASRRDDRSNGPDREQQRGNADKRHGIESRDFEEQAL